MSATTPDYIARGTINPCTILVSDNTTALGVTQSTSNQRIPVGVAQEGAAAAPIPGAATSAATTGNGLRVLGIGEVAQVTVGSGGLTAGDEVISDASGQGVTGAQSGTTIQYAVGWALETAAAGEKCRVLVSPHRYRPT